MKCEMKVLCTHPEKEVDRNIECKLIDCGDLDDFYFKCPICKREIGVIFKIGRSWLDEQD